MSKQTSHLDLMAASVVSVQAKSFQENQWGKRHAAAWNLPRGNEVGIVNLIRAIGRYADLHENGYHSRIGDDSFGAPIWIEMIRSARQLLNFDIGRLDGGTLDSLLCNMLKLEGYDSEGNQLGENQNGSVS